MQPSQPKQDLSLQIENLKIKNGFATYLETIMFYYENCTDLDMDSIAKLLNQKIRGCLEVEAVSAGLVKRDNMIRLI